jgi:hypothetical protein
MASSCNSSLDSAKIHEQAAILCPLIQTLLHMHHDGNLPDHDFVGIVILLNLSLNNPNRWLRGYLVEPIVVSSYLASADESSKTCATYQSIQLSELPEAVLTALNLAYIWKKLSKQRSNRSLTMVDQASLTVIDVFNQLQFYGIKNKDDYINKSMVYWSLGGRPYELMFTIPSPMTVLRQQATGRRVITVFTTYEELISKHVAQLYYMDGSQLHARSSFDFSIHDMKHMELFIDPSIYDEQVGFFRSILQLGHPRSLRFLESCIHSLPLRQELPGDVPEVTTDFAMSIEEISKDEDLHLCKPCIYFTSILGLDEQLWHELEYVISDMSVPCFFTLL